MSRNLKVLLEFEKLSNPYSGLGQFCLNLGKSFINNVIDINFKYLVPENYSDQFTNFNNIIKTNRIRRIFPYSGNGYDIWHCIHQESPYFPRNKNTKVVLTIHDLNFLHKDYPKWKKDYKLQKLQNKIDKSHAITTISNFTKEEINKNLNVSSNKIFEVIYNGNNLSDSIKPVLKSNLVPDCDYLFSLGIVNHKKNFKALVPLLNYNKNLKLIIAGMNTGNYSHEIMKYAKELNFEDRVILTGAISESAKYSLYENCLAFVFPSLSEGFGLPVVEAMSFGKPIFLSNLTSLPEIGAKSAYYWDRFEPDYMLEIFSNGIIDYNNNSSKKIEIIKRSKEFTWKNSALKYIDLYKNI